MKLSFLHLRGIGGQLAALVVASILAIHLIIATLFFVHRPDQSEPPGDRGHAQLASAIQLLGAAPASERQRLAAGIARAFPQLGIENVVPGSTAVAGEADERALHDLNRRLGNAYRIIALDRDGDTQRIAVTLPDGATISARLRTDRQGPPFLGGPWMMTLLFAVISMTLLGLCAARALTAPLSAFAKAAESFSLDGATSPLPERGPVR